MKLNLIFAVALSALSTFTLPHSMRGQGSLTPPPGIPAPTMKTLDQIEPRTLIKMLPYTISRPGHYYLTTNLTALGSGSSGITVQANDVTLDLNGFSLIGTGTNDPGAFPVGIWVPSTILNFTMRNGSVRNWGYGGISATAAGNSRFEKLTVSDNRSFGYFLGNGCTVVEGAVQNNGGIGLNMGEASTVRNCVLSGNVGIGLFVAAGSLVKDCVSVYNYSKGIEAGTGSTLSGCTVRGNIHYGIHAALRSTISGCTAEANGWDGILSEEGGTIVGCTAGLNLNHGIAVALGATIKDCTAQNNTGDGFAVRGSSIAGSTAHGNGDDGIHATGDCLVTGNLCRDNGGISGIGAGIHVEFAGNRIEGNTMTVNRRGVKVDIAGNIIVKNSSRANGSNSQADNFSIAAGNHYGTILVNPGSGFTSSAAWANLMF